MSAHELPASRARFVGERVVRQPDGGCVVDWQVTVSFEVFWDRAEQATADGTLELNVDMDGGGSQFGILVAGKLQHRITTSGGRDRYKLRLNADARRFSVELVKLNEPAAITVCCPRKTSAATVHAFLLSPGWAFAEAKPADRRIEVLGGSNPAGFGIEGAATEISTCAMLGISLKKQNALNSFAYILARMFQAELSLVAWSGVGVHRNAAFVGDRKLEEHYGRAVAARDEPPDWQAWQPDVVLTFAGSNDLYGGKTASSQAEWIGAFVSLLQCIRAKRPNAFIICGVSCHGGCPTYERKFKAGGGNKLPGYTRAAVEQFGDARCVVADIQPDTGLAWPQDGGSMEHWGTVGHVKIARAIAPHVEALTSWTQVEDARAI